jgi:hypothetical protein
VIIGPRAVGQVPKARDAPRAPRLLMAALVLLLGLLALASAAQGAGGDLDPTFNGDGKVLTDFRAAESANAVAVQGNGKLVVAGLHRQRRVLLRLRARTLPPRRQHRPKLRW